MLASLDPSVVQAIRDRFVSVAVAGGWPVFEQGEEGDALYTLVSGAVGIFIRDFEAGETQRIARLASPQTFGELALLSAEPRFATATALRDTHLLRLWRTASEEVIECHPKTLLYFARRLAERLRAVAERRSIGYAPRSFAVLAVADGPDPAIFGHQLAEDLDTVLPGEAG